MSTIIEQQVKDIVDITELLSNGTIDNYINNIEDLKQLAQVVLDKLSIIEREKYALSDEPIQAL